MKIGIDLRFISDNLYSSFVTELVETLIKNKKEDQFILYGNGLSDSIKSKNVEIKNVNIKNGTFEEQTKFLKIINNDKNNLMLFFNHYKPIFYRGQYITLVANLKDIYYMNFNSFFEKYKFLFLMGKNFKKSHNIICFDQNTKNELIEKFDIIESKIKIIDGFFPRKKDIEIGDNEIHISIKAKYSIVKEYFVYSGGNSIEKNYDKLINLLSKLKEHGKDIAIVFLGHHISSNLNLRNLILEKQMQNNVYFLGMINEKEKKYLYEESLGTIFPSFYEPFPFHLGEPLFYSSQIISSDLKSIKNIFGEEIMYFSPMSVNSIFDSINTFLVQTDKRFDYSKVLSKYNKDKTTEQLIEIIG